MELVTSGEHCESCKFGELLELSLVDGQPVGYLECRRFPPVLRGSSEAGESAEQEIVNWIHPLVIGSDWCGEYQPKVSESEPGSPECLTSTSPKGTHC